MVNGWELFFLAREFVNEINNHFLFKVVNQYEHITLDEVNEWIDDKEMTEGSFNFSHNDNPSVYVLDRIFCKNIEICDLLIEKEDKLYFMHIRDGLDRDTRVLVSQILVSMRLLFDAVYGDNGILEEYYNNIIAKINDPKTNEKESSLSISARKFKKRFPKKDSFINLLKHKKIVFVFAYRPGKSHDIYNPKTI